MSILLVEPDVVLGRIYQTTLEEAGFTVQLAHTAQAAVHAADTHTPDLVILELQLVSHSGIEFLYELRSYSEWQHIPVLALSHVPPTEFIDSWELLHKELGVAKYLYKPHITLTKLLRTVHEFIAKEVKDLQLSGHTLRTSAQHDAA